MVCSLEGHCFLTVKSFPLLLCCCFLCLLYLFALIFAVPTCFQPLRNVTPLFLPPLLHIGAMSLLFPVITTSLAPLLNIPLFFLPLPVASTLLPWSEGNPLFFLGTFLALKPSHDMAPLLPVVSPSTDVFPFHSLGHARRASQSVAK